MGGTDYNRKLLLCLMCKQCRLLRTRTLTSHPWARWHSRVHPRCWPPTPTSLTARGAMALTPIWTSVSIDGQREQTMACAPPVFSSQVIVNSTECSREIEESVCVCVGRSREKIYSRVEEYMYVLLLGVREKMCTREREGDRMCKSLCDRHNGQLNDQPTEKQR